MTDELLKEFEKNLASLTLTPSTGGRFEVKVNGELVYSKVKTRRHPEPGEIARIVRSTLALESP